MCVVQVVGRADRDVIHPLPVAAELLQVAIEPLELREEVGVREVRIDDAHAVVGIQGGNEPVAGLPDGLHVTRGDESGSAAEGEAAHGALRLERHERRDNRTGRLTLATTPSAPDTGLHILTQGVTHGLIFNKRVLVQNAGF